MAVDGSSLAFQDIKREIKKIKNMSIHSTYTYTNKYDMNNNFIHVIFICSGEQNLNFVLPHGLHAYFRR